MIFDADKVRKWSEKLDKKGHRKEKEINPP